MSATLLHGGRGLAQDGSALFTDLLLRNGCIAAMGPELAHPDAQRIDARGCLIIPGLVNGHTHAHGALARGAVPDRVSLEGFLAYAPALIGQRSVEDIYLSAAV